MRLAAELPGDSASGIIEMAERLGITGIGFDVNANLDLVAAQSMVQPFTSAGLTIVQLGCYRNLISVDHTVRTQAIADVASAMNVAGSTGIEAVVCGGGHRDPASPTARRSVNRENWSDLALEVIVDSCRQIVSLTHDTAAPLCLEPWVITCLNTPARVERVVRGVDHPKLAVELDLANLVTIERYYETDQLIMECFDRFGDKIRLVHLKDARLRPEPYIYHIGEAVVGDGEIDHAALLEVLTRHAPDASLMIEHLHSEADAQRAVDHMRSLAARLDIVLD